MVKLISVLGALVPILAIAVLWVFQRGLIYPAPPPRDVTVAGYDVVTLATADGLELRALYRPAAPGRATLLFFHGNGDTLTGSATAVAALVAAGHGALLLEYRGYGGNPGRPSEAGLNADAAAALAFLRGQAIADTDIVVIGNSIGSGPATALAAGHDLGGLVLVSGYTSLPAVVRDVARGLPIGWLVRDKFNNLAALPRVTAPVLVLHGARDRVIGFAHGAALGALRGVGFGAFADAGHELAYRPEAQAAITAWLAERHRHAELDLAKAAP